MASVTKFLKFPIFRKVDVFFDKNDNFSKNSGHACLIPLSLAFAQNLKIDQIEE